MFKNDKEVEIYDLVNRTTGETITTSEVEVKPGNAIKTVVTTEAQRNSYKHKQELDAEMRENTKDEGNFIQLIYKYGTSLFKELEEKTPGNKSNLHCIRFIILATYADYNGELTKGKNQYKTRIKKSHLSEIWNTENNRKSVNETYNILVDCGYIYEEDGYLMINKDVVIKGPINDYIKELRKEDKNYNFTRIFIDNVREMYKDTDSKHRKHLANLFKILPYVNFKHNVLCANPKEEDAKKLELYNWTNLAEKCGYNADNASRLKKELMNLKIAGCDVIGELNRGSGKTIIVNPKIYYAGDDIKDVINLYNIFEMTPNKNK